MDAERRIALAKRIVAACRASNDGGTCHAVSEVALAIEVNANVRPHTQPLLRALSLVDALRNNGSVDALVAVLEALEQEKAQ